MPHYPNILPLFFLLFLSLSLVDGAEQPPSPEDYNPTPKLTSENYSPPQNNQTEPSEQSWFGKYMGAVRTPGTPETVSWGFWGIPFYIAMLWNSGTED